MYNNEVAERKCLCVCVCFARNNDEMFERDSIWSETLIKFSKRETFENISRCCSYYVLALHFQRERERPRVL